jgi:FkbM family methyltransferase
MTFLDVGAHIGEFTLVGAKMVGREGRVIAVEPLAPCAGAIRQNAALNDMSQVQVYEGALAERSGEIGFNSDAERSGGWIARNAGQAAFEAQCWSLDDFLAHAGITAVDVAKLDASGNELAVLRGAAKTLPAGRVRSLVMKLYHPDVVRERFGYDAHESVALLHQWGFALKLVVRQEAYPILRAEDVDSHYDHLVYSHLLVATTK